MVARDVKLPTVAHVNLNEPNIRVNPAELRNATDWFRRMVSFPKIQILAKCRAAETFPETDGEVAFVGRSNVGKSSLLNALVFKKRLAITSSKPGCTQKVGFYRIGRRENVTLVDLPGYGYAEAPTRVVNKWNILIGKYIRLRKERQNLKCVFLLVDARHGFLPRDKAFARFLDEFSIPYQVVLTKVDRLSKDKLSESLKSTREFLLATTPEPEDTHPRSARPLIHMISSEVQDHGLPELRHTILSLICPAALTTRPKRLRPAVRPLL